MKLLFDPQAFKFILILVILITRHTGIAQQNITFKHLTNTDGLSQSNVIDIIQDNKGYMWFCTRDGLNKYNGYEFTVYKNKSGDSTSLAGNDVRDIIDDRNGNLWIATFGGLNKYNRDKDNFTQYKTNDGKYSISDNNVECLLEDSNGYIWIGTSNGLDRLNLTNGKITTYHHVPEDSASLTFDNIVSLEEDQDGNIWVGTFNGLNKIDFETNKITQYYHDPRDPSSITDNTINEIYEDKKGNLWIATNGGLNLYNSEKDNFKQFKHEPNNSNSLAHNVIRALNEDVYGNIWIGTENGGLNIYDVKNNIFHLYKNDDYDQHTLSNNSIYSIYRDKRNSMWIGTYSGGVNFYDRDTKSFIYYRSQPNDLKTLAANNVYAIDKDSNGNIWVAMDGGGINMFNPKTQKFTRYMYDASVAPNKSIGGNYVLTMIVDHQDNVWAGTWGDGISVYDINAKTFRHYKNDPQNSNSLSLNNIMHIYEDSNGDIWVSTIGGGINLLKRQTNDFTHYRSNPENPNDPTTISDNFPNSVYEDKKGNIWVGFEAAGAYLFNRAQNKFYHFYQNVADPNSLRGKQVIAFFEDSKGNFWLGTDKGINLFNYADSTFKAYSKEDGLPSNVVKSILEDDNGSLWLGTNNGISKFDPANLTFKNYTPSDGLQGNEFNRSAALKTRDGNMYFGGPNGLNVFYPDSIKDNDFIPPVVFTGFQIFNKEVPIGSADPPLQHHISETDHIELSYQQSVFSFEFAALNYTSSEKNQYAYQLEGFDKGWNYVGNKRSATYTNLNPGEYIFKVKASNNDGIWNEKGASIELTITPPFWAKWYFKTFVVLFIIGILLSIYLIRIRVIQSQKIELERQVDEKTRDLSKINEELNQFAYIVSHDLKAPLRGIATLADWIKEDIADLGVTLTEDIKDNVKLLDSRIGRMQNLIEGILNYSRVGRIQAEKEELKSYEVVHEVISLLNVPKGYTIDMKGEFPVIFSNKTWLQQVFANLLSNAIKYHDKEQGKITIAYEDDAKFHIFSVEDDGPGIAKEYQEKIFKIFQTLQSRDDVESTGIGLTIVKKIIEELGGKIWIESDGENGSKFLCTIPK